MSESNPISERRLAANRENAKKSTGPRTPEGRARSSQNAVKHGFRSSSFTVVRVEELDEIENLRADAVHCYRPVNAQELVAVERIALSQQMIFRGARLDAGMFTSAMNEVVDRTNNPVTPMDPDMVGDGDIEITRQQNRNYCIAEGFRRIAKESNAIGLMLRYRAQAEREYRRAIEDFDRLKALRQEMPNEPNVGLKPPDPEDIIPIRELNWELDRYPQKKPNEAKPNEPTAPVPNEANEPVPNEPTADSPAPDSSIANSRSLEASWQLSFCLAWVNLTWMNLICFLRLCFGNRKTAGPSYVARSISALFNVLACAREAVARISPLSFPATAASGSRAGLLSRSASVS